MSVQLMIILGYLGLTIWVGMFARRKSGSAKSFHGANLGVLMCVAAGTGEWLGGTSTTGISEYGFAYGISGAWYTLANGIGVIVLALFFAKLYRSLDTVTIPGIIEKFIGQDARVVSSILLTFVMIVVGTAQIIAAGTLGVSVLGMDFTLSVVVFGISFIVYTFFGGMRAVGYTNIIHLAAMYGGVILAIIFVGKDIGGIENLGQMLPAQPYYSMTDIGMPKVSSWVIASILGACTAQAGIQPLLAAKDGATAKKAAVITAFVVAPFGLLTALLGMAARVKFPELENAKLALPLLMMNFNPLVGGIVLAAITAAILSTISPIILASGTMVTKDIYHCRINPLADDAKILWVSRVFTSLSGVVCIVLALAVYHAGARILDVVYFAYTIRGALFVVLLFGIYWKKVTQPGAITAMVLTSIAGVFWVVYKKIMGAYPIHPYFTETYAALIVAGVSTVLFSIFPKAGP
ncbi:MAG: sodium:solute symporter family protein [Desulfobacter sp.]|nr:sodium:solute symporter family protein [Desulfobacter sp.]